MSFGYRTDVGTLRPPKRNPDGRLQLDAYITKPGIFEYADKDYPGGIRRELRQPSEVFNQDTLDSFAQVPVTNGHPAVGMIDAKNARQYMVGSTGERVTKENDHVKTSVMIADDATSKKLDGGDVEVSCGYACRLDETPGVDPTYGRYDVRQYAIRGNHLAVGVGIGRAGRTARVRMDSELTSEERNNMPAAHFAAPGGSLPIEDAAHTRAAMARFNQTNFADAAAKVAAFHKITAAAKRFGIDSADFEKEYGGARMDARAQGGHMAADPDKLTADNSVLANALTIEKARADKAEAECAQARADAAQARGEMEVVKKTNAELEAKVTANALALETDAIRVEKTRADKAEAIIARHDAAFGEAVKARSTLIAKVQAHMGIGFRCDDLDERQMISAVVKRLDANCGDLAGKETAEIKGMFNALTAKAISTAAAVTRASEVLSHAHKEAPRVDAKEAQRAKASEAWKQPLSNDTRAVAGGKGI